MRRVLLAFLLAALALPAAASAQQNVTLAAPSDCLTNPGCGAGLKRVYKLDVSKHFYSLTVADAGISALDDKVGQVAVAFSSNPNLTRADLLSLRDDKGMIGSDHVVPVIRRKSINRLGKGLRRRLDTASSVLTTSSLQGLNGLVLDGRLAEAVGAEFSDANGLSNIAAKPKKNRRVIVGYMDFDESEILAHFYAEALRGAGFDARVKSVKGFRDEALSAIRKGTIDLYAGYSRSLAAFILKKQVLTPDVRPDLTKALATIGARPAALAPATDQNVFVMKRDVAASLGISKISDLGKYWPKAS